MRTDCVETKHPNRLLSTFTFIAQVDLKNNTLNAYQKSDDGTIYSNTAEHNNSTTQYQDMTCSRNDYAKTLTYTPTIYCFNTRLFLLRSLIHMRLQ